MEHLGKSGKVDFQSSRRLNTEDSFGKSKRYEYRSSRQTPTDSFGNSRGNGFRDSSHGIPVHSFGGPSNTNADRIPRSSVYYGYGGPFSLDDDFDRRSDNTQISSDSIRSFKIQPWMTKITGGTFKRDYIDRVSFRPTLQHDSTILWGDTRQLTEADDREPIRGSSNEESIGRTTLTIIFIILGVILVGVVGAVIAWFLAMKDDGPEMTTYFIVSGRIHLNEVFLDELDNSSAPEFKNLSFRFCSAIREALQKNITKYGERFKHCEVNEFRNGSIVVQFTVYYVYSSIVINKEGVEEDLNVSLTAIDSKTSYLSDLIVITSTINLTVTVETFTVDPIAIPITSTPSTTTATIYITTTSKSGTTFTATDTSSIEDEVTEVTAISALESTTAGMNTTSVEDEVTEVTTLSTLESTTTGINTKSVEDEATDVTTLSTLKSTTTGINTKSVEDEVTEFTTISALESTTTGINTKSVEDEVTEVTTLSTLKSTTTGINTKSVEEEATDVTTISALESTTAGIDITSVEEEATDATTILALESTTAGIDTTSVENKATQSKTISAFESTTDRMDTTSAEDEATDEATDVTTVSALESTTVGIDTTKINNKSTTDVQITENSESTISIVDSTILPETTAKLTTEIENTKYSIKENVTSMYSTTEYSRSIITEPTTEMEIISTSIKENVPSTTFDPTIAAEEYSAGVHVPDIVAVVEKITHVQACEVIPKGNWLYVNISVDYQGTSIVKEKYDHNNDISKIISHDRFNINIYMKNNTVVANLTLNLTSPISRICNLYDQYIFTCSVMMNDTFHTTKSNGSRIHITAPVAPVTIDSRIHYDEGDKMYFNCSTKVDPNYSKVKAQFIKNDIVIHEIVTTDFGNINNSDCSFNLNWIDSAPYPLTADANGIIVRCNVTNTLLNKTEFADKVLNVTIAEVAFSQYYYKMLIEKTPEIKCIARGASSIFKNLTLSRNNMDIAVVNSSGVATVLNAANRYKAGVQEKDDNVILNISIEGLECEDHGTYKCSMNTKDNSRRTSPAMSLIVLGTKPTLKMHPDIYESLSRLDSPHVCATNHTGNKDSNTYLEIQITSPNNVTTFRYSHRLPDSEKYFDELTYINITEFSQFLLVSDQTSNSTCNNQQSISFLLSLTMEFNNGVVKCVLKDDMNEYASVESRITVIPGNYCDGYMTNSRRKYPNNDCNKYVYCGGDGKMYAYGRECSVNQCVIYTGKNPCIPCESNYTCDELTTPGPTTTLTTLPPDIQYISCNDYIFPVDAKPTVTCIVLNKTFKRLDITFLPTSAQGDEDKVGVVFSNGTIESLRSDVNMSISLESSPMILYIKFQLVTCNTNGHYRITATGRNSSLAQSIETFELKVIGNLTEFELHMEDTYREGSTVQFNCSAILDESQADIKAFYKRETEDNFTNIQGSTEITKRNDSFCFVKIVWKPSVLFIADASFNNAEIKCEITKGVLASRSKNVIVKSSDVTFDTYRIESYIGAPVSTTCMARNVDHVKSISIRKNEANVNFTIATFSLPNTVDSIEGVNTSYTNNSLTVTIKALHCLNEGNYTCAVTKQDDSEIIAPAQLCIQPKGPPKMQSVALRLNPDINEVEYRPDRYHSCIGDVGYPEAEGYLSITFVHPSTNASFTYEKRTINDAMKTQASMNNSIYLAQGLSIVILEDYINQTVNCSIERTIRFVLDITREWNKAKIRCSVKKENSEIKNTPSEEEIYVIPKNICDGTDGNYTHLPHEKMDHCHSYVICHHNKPSGKECSTLETCFDHTLGVCGWCNQITCESENATLIADSTELKIKDTS